MHRELLDVRPHAGITAYIRRKHIRWRAQINDTRRLLLSELRMLVCGPDEALEAKDDHFWALRRLPAHAVAAIQGRRPWRRPHASSQLPPSPTPSPPDSPDEDGGPGDAAEGGPSHGAQEETAGPSEIGPSHAGAGGDGRAQRGGVTVEATSPTPAARHDASTSS